MSLITALSCVSTASHVKSRETSILKMADSAGEKKLAEEKKGEEPIEPEEQPMEIDSATEKDETGPKAGGGDVKPEPDKVEAPSVDVKKDEPDVSLENKKESGGESDTTQSIDKIEKPETADSQNSQATEVEAAKDPTETISKKIASSSESEKGDNVVKPEVQDKGVIAPEEPKPVGANEKVPEIDTKSGTKEKAQSEESMQIDGESPDTNSEHCYCGKDRNLGSIELQCAVCLCWYHNGCINCYIGTCMPFMTNYQFGCKRCNVSKIESFTRKTATFSHMCLTAMANLTHQKPNTVMFSKDKDIIPYIDKHWENLTSMPRRVKLTWHNTVLKTMTKESEIFVSKEDTNGDYLFALLNPDLTRVGPGLEALKAVALASRNSDIKTPPSFEPKTGRSTKRRFPVDYQQLQGSRLKRSEMGVATKMAPHGYPLEHPFNKDGYRYILAESDPHAPNRQAFDESLDWAGKPIPGYLYRTFLGSAVLLALHDRAPQLKISDSRLTVIGDKGYSMIRATHGVRYGSWYFEVTIDDMPAESATRIGWSQPLGNLQAPCGYDKFSYSWRSCKGTRFHQSRGKHYTEEGYGTGDVLGFYVHLPQPEDPHKLLPPDYKDKPLVKFKSHLYYEEKDYVSETEKNLKSVPGSKIIAFKNGKAQPVAYEGIYEGVYYPAISLYKNATVSMNFGPTFKFPPKDLKDFRPMSEAATQAIIDHCLSDVIYHVENEGKQPEF